MSTVFSKLQVGGKLSESNFYNIIKIVGNQIQLRPDTATKSDGDSKDIVADKSLVESYMDSAEQYSSTKKVTRTELIQIFESSAGVVQTVNFNKKVDAADVVKELLSTHQNTAPKDVEKAFKATVKKTIDGEERTMIGRHYGSKDDFGRIHFTDMSIEKDPNKTYDVRQRLVDPRTLNWLIVRDVKYEVK